MNYEALILSANNFFMSDKCNYIQPDDAMREDIVGMRIFDEPVFACGRADDPYYAKLKDDAVLSAGFMFPDEWLPGARSVLSFFFPASERVRKANSADFVMPADEWLHCRIEGQEANNKFCEYICKLLTDAGYKAVAPSIDPRLVEDIANFRTNWSERHTAFICGHGTFGMSCGLITKYGMAGRFGSVITDMEMPYTARDYEDIYEYCIKCGLCAERCPADAIDPSRPIKEAKSHEKCRAYQGPIRSLPPRGKSQKVRYGCAKCQMVVPCETGIPGR